MRRKKITKFIAGFMAVLSIVLCTSPGMAVKAENDEVEITLEDFTPELTRENFQSDSAKTIHWITDDTTLHICVKNAEYISFIDKMYHNTHNYIINGDTLNGLEKNYNVDISGDGIHEILIAGKDINGQTFQKWVVVGIDKNGPDLTEFHGNTGFNYPNMNLNVVRANLVYDNYYIYTGAFNQGWTSSYNPGAGIIGVKFLSDTVNYEYTIPDTSVFTDPNNIIKYDNSASNSEIQFAYSKLPEGIYKNIKIQTIDYFGKTSVAKAINEFRENSSCGNDFAFDKTPPKIESVNISNGYVNSNKVIYQISDNVGLQTATYTLDAGQSTSLGNWRNGTSPVDKENVEVTLPTVDYGDDENYKIKVSAQDLGYFTNDLEQTVKFDMDAPVINTASIDKSYIETDKGLAFAEAPTLTIAASDEKAGLEAVYLVDESGNETKIENGSIKIEQSGKYSIKATDKLGNEAVKTLKDVLNLPSNEIYINSTKPVIEYQLPDGIDVNGTIWYKGDIDVVADLSNTIGLEKADLYINDTKVNSVGTIATSISANTSLVNTDDCEYVLKTEAVNDVGASEEKTTTIKIDKFKPEISNISVVENKDDLFTINVTAADKGSGIKEYIAEDVNGRVKNSATGTFELAAGSYTFKVYDNVGNITTKTAEFQLKDGNSNLDNNDTKTPSSNDDNEVKIPANPVNESHNQEVVQQEGQEENKAVSTTALKTGDDTPLLKAVVAFMAGFILTLVIMIVSIKKNRRKRANFREKE